MLWKNSPTPYYVICEKPLVQNIVVFDIAMYCCLSNRIWNTVQYSTVVYHNVCKYCCVQNCNLKFYMVFEHKVLYSIGLPFTALYNFKKGWITICFISVVYNNQMYCMVVCTTNVKYCSQI